MLAKLRNCCRTSAPVGASAAWLTPEAPARMATPRAVQNGTLQNNSRRSPEDVMTGSHDSTADQRGRKAPTKTTWESTRALVLGLADIIPEDKYDFRPTPAVRTFREILIHLIGENYTFFSRVSGDNLGSNARFDALRSRAEIMKALQESYDYGARVWEGLTEEKALEMVAGRGGQQVQRWAAILGVIHDNMNHYGNLVVYVRLNGMVPPRSAPRN